MEEIQQPYLTIDVLIREAEDRGQGCGSWIFQEKSFDRPYRITGDRIRAGSCNAGDGG